MPRIDTIFDELRAGGKKALMPFVCAGYPAPGALGPVLGALKGAGARIVEVGIPYSDPIADGPVIAAAMHEALGNGTTVARVFDQVRAFRAGEGGEAAGVRDAMVKEMLGGESPPLGLVAMVSVSIVHRCGGLEGFPKRAADAGFDAVLVPDLTVEDSEPLLAAAAKAGVNVPMLIAPSTSKARAERIVRTCTGFVYLLARAGTTGESAEAPDVGAKIGHLRGVTDLPIVVGFGISTAAQVRAAVRHADGVIVGSALVRRMGASGGQSPEAAVRGLVGELSAGLAG